MIEGQVVSRTDLYGESDRQMEEQVNEYPTLGTFDFVEVDVDNVYSDAVDSVRNQLPDETTEAQPNFMEFQLFAGSQPVAISLAEPEYKEHTGRPIDFYLFKPSSDLRHSFEVSAISGDYVRKEASFWAKLAEQNPVAPDINHDYIPRRRKCRPGKQTRLNKKLKHERLAKEKKLANERFKQQRRKFQFRKKPQSR